MTEPEWEGCKDPKRMLGFLAGLKLSDRKYRLTGCAGHRLIPPDHFSAPGEVQEAEAVVVMAERHADGLASAEELEGVRCCRIDPRPGATWTVASRSARYAAEALADIYPALATRLRCLFSPFRRVRVDPAWLSWQGATVVALAQAAYDNRQLPAGLLDNARLAVLADALEESGCQDAHLLGHLRSGGEHVRGCFAVDLVLGKV